MPALPRSARSLVILALVLTVSSIATPAHATQLDARKWGSCAPDHTMSGAAAGPGTGFEEPGDKVTNYTVRIGPGTGYARSWADAGYQCVPDPQPHEKAKKIVMTDHFRVDGTETISCDSTSINISWPPGISHNFCDEVKPKTVELSFKTVCKAKEGVYDCGTKYTRWTIEAEGGVKFFRYCRQTRTMFKGPTGKTISLTAPESMSDQCLVNKDFFD